MWNEILLGVLSVAASIGGYAMFRLHKAINSYMKGYGQELGRIRATDEKLDQVLNQVANTVEISEQIKSDIDKKKNFSNVWASEFFTILNEVFNFKNEFVSAYTQLWLAEVNNYINEPEGVELQENLKKIVIGSYALEIKIKSYACFLDDGLSEKWLESSSQLFNLTRTTLTNAGTSRSKAINPDELICMLSAQNKASLEAHKSILLKDA